MVMRLQKDNIPATIRKLHPKMSYKKYEENLKDDFFLEKTLSVCYTCYCDVVDEYQLACSEPKNRTQQQGEALVVNSGSLPHRKIQNDFISQKKIDVNFPKPKFV